MHAGLASQPAIGSRTATGEPILILQFVNSAGERERERERDLCCRARFHLVDERCGPRYLNRRGPPQTVSRFETQSGIDTLNPGLFASAVAQRAARVVPLTASVFRNCLRQRRRELTRRNHLLLALAQVRPGLILRVEGSACGPTSVLRRNDSGRGISSGVMLLATRHRQRESRSSMNLERNERDAAR